MFGTFLNGLQYLWTARDLLWRTWHVATNYGINKALRFLLLSIVAFLCVSRLAAFGSSFKAEYHLQAELINASRSYFLECTKASEHFLGEPTVNDVCLKHKLKGNQSPFEATIASFTKDLTSPWDIAVMAFAWVETRVSLAALGSVLVMLAFNWFKDGPYMAVDGMYVNARHRQLQDKLGYTT